GSNVQVGEYSLEFTLVAGADGRRRGRSQNAGIHPDRRAGHIGWIVNQTFYISMLGDQLKDVLFGQLAESGAQENIMANVIDSRNQILKGNKGRIAQQSELAGTVGKGCALKKGESHAEPKFTGGLWILYQNRPARSKLSLIQ